MPRGGQAASAGPMSARGCNRLDSRGVIARSLGAVPLCEILQYVDMVEATHGVACTARDLAGKGGGVGDKGRSRRVSQSRKSPGMKGMCE